MDASTDIFFPALIVFLRTAKTEWGVSYIIDLRTDL